MKASMIKEELKNLIQKTVKSLRFRADNISIESPENPLHGDYSTNVALVLAKQLGKNPREVAEEIVDVLKLEIRNLKFLDKIEAAGPGFINFFLSKEYLFQELGKAVKEKEKYGARLRAAAGDTSAWQGKKIIIEFTDPNPFKEFHIGHLYSNIVGETLAKLFEVTGAKVKRANYQGDIGMHVAKAIWGMQQKMNAANINLQELEKKNLQGRIEFLSQSYAKGAKAFKDGSEAKKEIEELNKKIFACLAPGRALDTSVKNLYQKSRKWSLEYFEKIYKRLGAKFNFYYFESEVGKTGLKLVKDGLKKGVFKESEGAIIFPGEQYGLHNRVFVNSQGLPTYEAKELGLAPTKYKDFPYDLSIVITGNEVNEYFKVVLAVLKRINPKLGEKTLHIGHGMVRLPGGKMSSRTGNVVTGEQLLEEVKTRVRKLMKSAEKPANIPLRGTSACRENEEIAEAVAVGAVKYSLLKVGIGKDIVFDFERSLSIEGDSGPYLQYTYARCKSILRKSRLRLKSAGADFKHDFSEQEIAVLRLISRFPEVVQDATEKFSPNLICNFAFDLAQQYNLFYNTHSVLRAETKEAKEFRLLLTAAVAQVIQNSLFLLGIQTPERM